MWKGLRHAVMSIWNHTQAFKALQCIWGKRETLKITKNNNFTRFLEEKQNITEKEKGSLAC